MYVCARNTETQGKKQSPVHKVFHPQQGNPEGARRAPGPHERVLGLTHAGLRPRSGRPRRAALSCDWAVGGRSTQRRSGNLRTCDLTFLRLAESRGDFSPSWCDIFYLWDLGYDYEQLFMLLIIHLFVYFFREGSVDLVLVNLILVYRIIFSHHFSPWNYLLHLAINKGSSSSYS